MSGYDYMCEKGGEWLGVGDVCVYVCEKQSVRVYRRVEDSADRGQLMRYNYSLQFSNQTSHPSRHCPLDSRLESIV